MDFSGAAGETTEYLYIVRNRSGLESVFSKYHAQKGSVDAMAVNNGQEYTYWEKRPLSMRTRLMVSRERWSNGGIDLFPVPKSRDMFEPNVPIVWPGQFTVRCDRENEMYEEPPAGSKDVKPVLVSRATIKMGILIDVPNGRWLCAQRTEDEVIRGLKFPPKQEKTRHGLALQVVE